MVEAFQQLSGNWWGLYCLQCSCSEPERQLPTASPGESKTCVWVSLGRQGSHRHNPALVCHYGHFISSCWASSCGLAEEGRAGHKWPGVGGQRKAFSSEAGE